MAKEIDYHNFDKLEMTAKTIKAKEVARDYALFGWEEIERRDDKRILDLTHFTFIRPHKIANKDKLQLLQIYYENYMNEIYVCEKNRGKTSFAYIVSTLFLGAILLAIGVFILLGTTFIAKVLGALFLGASLVLLVCGLLRIKKLKNMEKEKFKQKYSYLKDKIESVLNDAVYFSGWKDEKN